MHVCTDEDLEKHFFDEDEEKEEFKEQVGNNTLLFCFNNIERIKLKKSKSSRQTLLVEWKIKEDAPLELFRRVASDEAHIFTFRAGLTM